MSYVVDRKINMTAFDALPSNDAVGAPAYARGMISSRDIAFACEQNVIFMALSARSEPHFTTIAQFIREMGPVIKGLFVDVLLYCDELGLIGREMFAINGCKISSNASKEWSGTWEDFEKKKTKFTKLVETLVAKHRAVDEEKADLPAEVQLKEEKAIKALEEKIVGIQGSKPEKRFFEPDDFKFNERGKLECPAGSELYIGYRNHVTPKRYCQMLWVGMLEAFPTWWPFRLPSPAQHHL